MSSLCLQISKCRSMYGCYEIFPLQINKIEEEILKIKKDAKFDPEKLKKIQDLWQEAVSCLYETYLEEAGKSERILIYKTRKPDEFEARLKNISLFLMPYLQAEQVSELFLEFANHSDVNSLQILYSNYHDKISIQTIYSTLNCSTAEVRNLIVNQFGIDDLIVSLMRENKIDFLQKFIELLTSHNFSTLLKKCTYKIQSNFSSDQIYTILLACRSRHAIKFLIRTVKISLEFICTAIRMLKFDLVDGIVQKFFANNYKNLLMALIDSGKIEEYTILLQNDIIDENTIDSVAFYAEKFKKHQLPHVSLKNRIKEFEKKLDDICKAIRQEDLAALDSILKTLPSFDYNDVLLALLTFEKINEFEILIGKISDDSLSKLSKKITAEISTEKILKLRSACIYPKTKKILKIPFDVACLAIKDANMNLVNEYIKIECGGDYEKLIIMLINSNKLEELKIFLESTIFKSLLIEDKFLTKESLNFCAWYCAKNNKLDALKIFFQESYLEYISKETLREITTILKSCA